MVDPVHSGTLRDKRNLESIDTLSLSLSCSQQPSADIRIIFHVSTSVMVDDNLLTTHVAARIRN